MRGKKAWTDEEAEKRLGGLPSEESEAKAERFFSGEGKSPISDDLALKILQGRQPRKAVKESFSQKRSGIGAGDPIASAISAINSINSQLVGALGTSRREELVREVLRCGRSG